MSKMIIRKYIMRAELARMCGVSEETIKKYSDMALLNFIHGRHRIYETQTSIKRMKKIKNLKSQGYNLAMIKDYLSKK